MSKAEFRNESDSARSEIRLRPALPASLMPPRIDPTLAEDSPYDFSTGIPGNRTDAGKRNFAMMNESFFLAQARSSVG